MIWKLPDILQYMEHVLFFFFETKLTQNIFDNYAVCIGELYEPIW